MWIKPAQNQSACLNETGCKQPQFSVLSPKTGAQCTGCNGTVQNLYTWYQGTWERATWTPYRWQARQWLYANTWGPVFDRDRFQSDLDSLYYRHLAQVAKADLLCRYVKSRAAGLGLPTDLAARSNSRISNSLSLVSCDCSGGSNCYALPVPSFLGLSNACSGTYSVLSVRTSLTVCV